MNFAGVRGLLALFQRNEADAVGNECKGEWWAALKAALYAFLLSRLLIVFAAAIAFGRTGKRSRVEVHHGFALG